MLRYRVPPMNPSRPLATAETVTTPPATPAPRDGRSRVRPDRPLRPRELQDWLNSRIYHPLSWRMAWALAPTPITPNMVSVFGAAMVVAAGIAYCQPGWPWTTLLGLVLHMSWHVVDGADGDLARLTKRSGPNGEMVDGLCDYGSHTVVYLMLGWWLQQHVSAWCWIAVVAAGLSRIVQANHYEVQRRQYQWWAYGNAWLRQDDVPITGPGTALARLYLLLGRALAPGGAEVDAAFDRLASDPTRAGRAHDIARAHAADLLPSWRILGANSRTILLGLAVLAGSPLYYFLFEAVLLNLVLIASIHHAGSAAKRLEKDFVASRGDA
ncbi:MULTISPECIES: CDP-alcohol phosphatidyltransferase family protein [unclassified Novosphingobium]|uniref:CDP-alcohol phosphatidyltransferase family protein n=1 Tax=unclassified Novosphingobium TaxID=2644732 RepID=UPI00181ED74B|nr:MULTISPECIES: CDP-alcohol phosphatidyltransferase family protein [unclassified Novosphingobium]NMN89234.1 phosphatidylglycerophosphate synthase [Novosphingobium sp. SG916]